MLREGFDGNRSELLVVDDRLSPNDQLATIAVSRNGPLQRQTDSMASMSAPREARSERSRRRARWITLAICAGVLFYAFPYYPELNNPNENVRFYMTAALVEEGTYRIDGPRARWGWVNDAACVESTSDGRHAPCDGSLARALPGASVDRHYYSVKAPGASLLGVPAFALYRALAGDSFDRAVAIWVVRVGASILPLLALLFVVYAWLEREGLEPFYRDGVVFTLAMGTTLLGYANLFASHTTAAAATMGAFMILRDIERGEKASPLRLGLAGLLAASASLFEYPAFFASLGLSIYALLLLRRSQGLFSSLFFFAVGALLPVVMLMHFQHSAFGNAFTPGHLFVENPAFRAGHEEGFYGARLFHPDGAWRLLFDRGLGLFGVMPFLLLAPFGFYWMRQEAAGRLGRRTVVFICLSMYVSICFMNNWHGGWSIGPRYLTPLVPLLAWISGQALQHLSKRSSRATAGLALGAMAASFLSAGIPSLYYPHLPPEFIWPMAHLFAPLITDGYAPLNAGQALGLQGTLSMLPVVALMLAALLSTAARLPAIGLQTPDDRRRIAALATLLFAAWAAFHLIAPAPSPETQKAVSFVQAHWNPLP